MRILKYYQPPYMTKQVHMHHIAHMTILFTHLLFPISCVVVCVTSSHHGQCHHDVIVVAVLLLFLPVVQHHKHVHV